MQENRIYCIFDNTSFLFCGTIQVYPDVDSPKFIDNTIAPGAITDIQLTVISFNIEKSLKN
ncbi:MAG: hypothetical protein ACI86M_001944 [Saprospiraceae bacterium]|jgi:hypothetical protein